ncbi:MAG: ABC transporter permease subunit [Calditerrivibrio sp.]|nr:ABC transporter permease subunit [Calditerrivibrio sp.]
MKNTNLKRKFIDRLARYIITIGGVGTIASVLLVFIFLLWTVFPLFEGGKVLEQKFTTVKDKFDIVHAVSDEYGLFTTVFDGKNFKTYFVQDGSLLNTTGFGGKYVAFSYSPKDRSYLISDEGGGLYEVKIEYAKNTFKSGDIFGKPIYQIKDSRLIEKYGEMESEYFISFKQTQIFKDDAKRKIVLLDGISTDNERFIAFLDDKKNLHVDLLTKKENMMTGEITESFDESVIDLSRQINKDFPKFLKINSSKTNIMLFFENSRYINIDVKNFKNPYIVEDKVLFSDGRKITYLDMLIGRNTVLIGDNKGEVTTWWPVESNLNKQNYILSHIHTFYSGSSSPIRFIFPSQRDKSFLILNEADFVSMYHMTSQKKLFLEKLNDLKGKVAVINQKNNRIIVLGEAKIVNFDMDIPHPEASFRSIFGKVQYELSSKPEHVWQSSSGSDDFEPKFGLMPLIFGTIKATIIAMLFAVPIAILAAIYTSEFAHKSYRNAIKSTIEVMASLPSVVLGFIAALIVSPFVENIVLGLLMAIIFIPFFLLFFGNLVQLMPKNILNNMDRYRIPLIAVLALPVGGYVGMKSAVYVEKILFYGDFKLWLHSSTQSPFGGWAIILLPLGVFITIYLYRTFLYDIYENLLENKGYTTCAVIEIAKFLVITIFSVLVTLLLAYTVTALGIDLRFGLPFIESIMSTYVQRNALIVGFIMGFAVIPIIYTVSEDALNAVPEHLRSASLAAGATQWQTVINIVLPVAMSGIFSAIMIGFGRAIGETMIVLMAAGNTPILDMNIFAGFRTLSANIAVELPEAVIGSTHYRILYLAALVLFLMTFVINTIAEMVRIRYRKRSSQL